MNQELKKYYYNLVNLDEKKETSSERATMKITK